MNERIREFLSAENKSSAQLAEEIGVQPSGISHILSGRNGPSLDFIQKILKRFPDLGAAWVVSGIGKMYPDEPAEPGIAARPKLKSSGPDLFSTDAEPESTPAEAMAKQDPANQEISMEEPVGVSDEQVILNASVRKKETPLLQERGDIDQIVIFYRDGSFSQYRSRD